MENQKTIYLSISYAKEYVVLTIAGDKKGCSWLRINIDRGLDITQHDYAVLKLLGNLNM